MDVRLYLLEIFVERISFSTFSNPPSKTSLKIIANMANFISLEMVPDAFRTDIQNDNNTKQDDTAGYYLGIGKSSLFPAKPSDMPSMIKPPLEFTILESGSDLAAASLPWTSDFQGVVKKSTETSDYIPPVQNEELLIIFSKTGSMIGDMKVRVCLTCLGNDVRTLYRFANANNKETVYLKTKNQMTVFQCQKVGGGSLMDVFPVAPIYLVERDTSMSKISWVGLFNSQATQESCSFIPGFYDLNTIQQFQHSASATTFDIISMIERPAENKCTDFSQMPNAGSVFIYKSNADERTQAFQNIASKDYLTVEDIEKTLCKCKDCPAAKKFKELGIGPLANTKSLGGLYNNVTPTVDYGLSQTYGTLDHYGPYGLYRRPKRPDQPFIPKDRGMDDNDDDDGKRYCEACNPLRLTGGGISTYDNIKSPYLECQDVMQEADKLVQSFRKALGPCGEVICPFSQNIMEDICNLKCPKTTEPALFAIQEMQGYPVEESQPTGQWNACGSPQCAYTKYKTGLVDEDAMMELRFLPPVSDSGKCQKSCPYVYEKDLPPIHWDCPDPLPEGPCKNPNCPFLPKDLKKLCKNTPCFEPTCPFTAQILSANQDTCGNASCPFYIATKPKDNADDYCGDPTCSYNPPSDNFSRNDDYCPFMEKQSMQSPSIHSCGNPNCPLSQQTESCINPCCPFLRTIEICPFISCPYARILNQATGNGNGQMSTCNECQDPESSMMSGRNLPSENIQDCPCSHQSQRSTNNGSSFQNNSPQPPVNKPTCQGMMQNQNRGGNIQNVCGGGMQNQPQNNNNNKGTCDCQKKNVQQMQKKATCKGRYRPSIQEDESPLGEGPSVYISDTRIDIDTAPCGEGTCIGKGGDLKCIECGKPKIKSCRCGRNLGQANQRGEIGDARVCPLVKKKYRCCPQEDSPTLEGEGQTEYTSDTRLDIDTAPCRIGTCVATAGDLSCDECKGCICGKNREQPPVQKPIPKCLQNQDDSNKSRTTSSLNEESGNKCPCQSGIGDGDQKSLFSSSSPNGSQKRKYRPSLVSDEAGAAGSQVEYTSDTRLDIDTAPCTEGTCLASGGIYECEECGAICQCLKPSDTTRKSKSDTVPKKKQKSQKNKAQSEPVIGKTGGKKRRKGRSKFVYSLGDQYPGIQIGHKECVQPSFNVPPKMGWLWNIFTPCVSLKPRRGWRPGAITRTVAARLKQYRKEKGLTMLKLPHFGPHGLLGTDSGPDVKVTPKPTLQIKKKDGCYWITMNPLKDPNTLAPNENPYMDCTPMQFKIVKNKTKTENTTGEQQSSYYVDNTQTDMKAAEESSSSDSELDIEFTPPAGIIHPERFKKKKNAISCNTQYDPKDLVSPKKKGKGKKGKAKKGKKGKKGKKK